MCKCVNPRPDDSVQTGANARPADEVRTDVTASQNIVHR
jgi:hypothetical protein